MSAPILLRPSEYSVLGKAFLFKLHSMGLRTQCLCCGATHVHVLYESAHADAKVELGRAKQYASHQLNTRTGSIWGRGCSVIDVRSEEHRRDVFQYICDHEVTEGAWVWREDRNRVPGSGD